MRLAFLGTPEAAVYSLEALVAAGHDVAVVITRPDRRRGRGSELSASPVKSAALGLGLRVAEDLAALDEVAVDLGVVVAYGAMIPASTLENIPMLNVHFSLLPRWRGAAPVERAILAGDAQTGVGVISLEKTLDTGPLHAQRSTDIAEKTSSELTRELARMGAELVVDVLADPVLLAHPSPQQGDASYAAKLTSETFHLRPDMTVQEALRVVRLERAFVNVGRRRVRILEARRGELRARSGTILSGAGAMELGLREGTIRLERVQPEGARAMSAEEWGAGARLGESAAWG